MEFFLKHTKIDDHAPQRAAFSGHWCKKNLRLNLSHFVTETHKLTLSLPN